MGSHSIRKSASYCIAKIIREQLQQSKQFEVDIVFVNKEPELLEIEYIYQSKILILVTPVYVDAPSSKLLLWMEKISKNKEKFHLTRSLRYVYTVANCGFYEAEHTNLIFDICRCFSENILAEYKFSLGIGCGQLITNMEQIKDYEKRIKKVLEKGIQEFVYKILKCNEKSQEDKSYIIFQLTADEYETLTCDYWFMLGNRNALTKEAYYQQSYNLNKEKSYEI